MKPNNLFPGLQKYTGPTAGYFAFVHHRVLWEYSPDIMERVAYIESDKPEHERETRLRHLLYLDPIKCPAVAKIKLLNDDYEAKRKFLNDDYEAKRKLLEAQVLAYATETIPAFQWDGKTLVFPDA